MESFINATTTNIITAMTNELAKEKTKKKIIKKVIQPILEDINKKYYPHFMAVLSLLIIMTIMMIGLTIIIYTSKN